MANCFNTLFGNRDDVSKYRKYKLEVLKELGIVREGKNDKIVEAELNKLNTIFDIDSYARRLIFKE